MTRFARAKGSKASNERICEESTSWHEMKEQLIEREKEIEDEEKRKHIEKVRNSNYQNFLKDRDEKAVNRSEWAEFPMERSGLKKNKCGNIEQSEVRTNNSKKRKITTITDNEIDSGIQSNMIAEISIARNKSKKSGNIKNNTAIEDDRPLEISSEVERTMPEIKKRKQKKKKMGIVAENQKKNPEVEIENKQNEEIRKERNSKSNSNEQKRKPLDIDSLTELEKKKIQKKQEKRRKQLEKKKLKKQEGHKELEKNQENKEFISSEKNSLGEFEYNPNNLKEQSENIKNSVKSKVSINTNKNVKNITKKEKKSGDFKRRKTFQPDKVVINGKEVEISYFDGFPIKKEDAQSLKQLKKQMISKGLPRSEINRTLKLERRKAEKALAREKKNVCFNCRKFGHVLSDCPELSSRDSGELVDSSGTGICFKCGSTEHTSFACRVVQGQNFKFATCFICKEQGHISRQCPDNARGLYPKGGSCNMCGDVTHLKKDCPEFRSIQEREQEKFQVEVISRGNPDEIDKDANYVNNLPVKPNKVIKF